MDMRGIALTGNQLTPNEESMVRELEYIRAEIERLKTSASNQYRSLIQNLGVKANCHLCGNAHWPLCKETD